MDQQQQQPINENDSFTTRQIIAPPGILRMILIEKPFGVQIYKILDDSPLHGKVEEGTTIISVDDVKAQGMKLDAFIQLLQRKSTQNRTLTVLEEKKSKESIDVANIKEGIYPASDLPDGWTVEYVKRKNGKNKDKFDKYWYSPKSKCRFRSMTSLAPFIQGVKKAGGDEEGFITG
eukprot:CAMPEP_0184858128 /NCGR_PEP_ID=MMETSP0580-20130426/3243_1 /TAXON_ID=1118495 /ORGANISM="Dactyliosolen fragilissimus" /LENGTH=175 /DNA_ID=CAMNT_0027354097 /DNA_START=192 /DNA_END=720 /DNA_ORIENTATION=-